MYSIYLQRKKEEDEIRKKKEEEVEKLISSNEHRRQRDTLATNYYSRVDDWMYETLAKPPPPPPKDGSESARISFRSRVPSLELGPACISARKYIPEKERLAEVIKQHEEEEKTSTPYSNPHQYYLRHREKGRELNGHFRFRFRTEQERLAESLSARAPGAECLEFSGPPPETFRRENPDKFKHGVFHAQFSNTASGPSNQPPNRADSPYFDPPDFSKVLRRQMYSKGPVSPRRWGSGITADGSQSARMHDDPPSPTNKTYWRTTLNLANLPGRSINTRSHSPIRHSDDDLSVSQLRAKELRKSYQSYLSYAS